MTSTTSPDPTAAIPVALPPTEVVVVVVDHDGTYTVGASTGSQQLPPARAVGILRAAAMQVARQHGVNGRDALEDALKAVVQAVVGATASEVADFQLAAPSEAAQ